jgi:hypothetical protein
MTEINHYGLPMPEPETHRETVTLNDITPIMDIDKFTLYYNNGVRYGLDNEGRITRTFPGKLGAIFVVEHCDTPVNTGPPILNNQ